MKFLILLLSLLSVHPAQTLVPKPVDVCESEGEYVLPETLPEDLSELPGLHITRVSKTEHPSEYILEIRRRKIIIKAADEDGVFYALQSLRQLALCGRSLTCCTIRDYPRYSYRAFMMDFSRNFYPVEYVKRQLDAMALLKMNVFHLHLEDNNGWRFQSERYPELTEKTAWRIGHDKGEWMDKGCRFVPEGTPGAVGGYFTKEDIREIIRYASERHIEVIPEIDFPSHAFSILRALPELACEAGWTGPVDGKPVVKPPKGDPAWKTFYHSDLCIGNPKTFEFIYNIIDEVAELFPSKYFHIGGDEASKEFWGKCPRCKALMEKNGIRDLSGLQNYLTIKVVEHLKSIGKTAIAWDDVVCEGLPDDIVLMHWQSSTPIPEGFDVIQAESDYTYLCNYQDNIETSSTCVEDYTPLNRTYSYNPDAPGVKGVEACLWTEWCSSEEMADRQIYPRLAAIAEIGWSPASSRDYADFRKRILAFNPVWNYLGIKPFDLSLEQYPYMPIPQGIKVNWIKRKAVVTDLPDPLRFADGRKVSAASWEERRREILDIFQSGMYGKMPPAPECLLTEVLEEGVCEVGFGIRRQIRMWFTPDKTGPHIDWLIVLPRRATEPVPAVMLLNYFGNHTILPDSEIIITSSRIRLNSAIGGLSDYAGEETRGFFADGQWRSTYPVGMLLAHGYAFVTACYADISPDPTSPADEQKAYTGVFDLWGERNPSAGDNTTSLGAWGWALMRGRDMLEGVREIDKSRILLTGSSRLGKAALIAGAFDDRFPVVVLNQTGGGGAPLAKHFYGENVATMTTMFPHWYCKSYAQYANHEAALPFDQHMILGAIAPRALLIEGFDDPWFDTHGEFEALKAAEPIWRMLGRGGLGSHEMPKEYDTSAIGEHLGYVRRDLEHGISHVDWLWMLDFAGKQWK